MPAASLRCSACAASYPLWELLARCGACGEPLEVHYEELPPGGRRRGESLLERYRAWLPFQELDGSLSLGEGGTPLLRAARLGRRLGLEGLYLKLEGLNPTGAFKDRGTVAGIQRARELGLRAVGTVSTGNMAASVAAYAARAGLRCFILVGAGMPAERFGPIAVCGPLLLAVRGDYGELYFESLRVGRELGVYFINSDDPFRTEGQKTVALEVVEQLAPRTPDAIFVPLSSGGHMGAIIKGLLELRRAGSLGRLPRVIGVQAEGCAPVARAFREGEEKIRPFEGARTIAHSISNHNPPSGNRILRYLRGGVPGEVMTVTDEEMLAAQRELAEEEGVFAMPDSATTLAAARRLRAQGRLAAEECVVAILAGHGQKDLRAFADAAASAPEVPLADLARSLRSRL